MNSQVRNIQTMKFQFTHPRGVRYRESCHKEKIYRFNSRTREGCDSRMVLLRSEQYRFNSRTREGCDFRQEVFARLRSVSIHAPARGAIPERKNFRHNDSFNSRTREGCDSYSIIYPASISVSIHAPARGAI